MAIIEDVAKVDDIPNPRVNLSEADTMKERLTPGSDDGDGEVEKFTPGQKPGVTPGGGSGIADTDRVQTTTATEGGGSSNIPPEEQRVFNEWARQFPEAARDFKQTLSSV
jgi:hypothetical protein